MKREETIAMIGRENLRVQPWTRLRTIVLVTFLGLGSVLMTLGIMFWGHLNAPVGIWIGGIIVFVSLLWILVDYFYFEVPNLVIKNPIQLEILEYEPITDGKVMVLGKDGKKHYLIPDKIWSLETIYLKYEEKSYFWISEKLNFSGPDVKLVLGKNYKEIITLPE